MSAARGSYDLTGAMLEACDCNVLCPCWVGEDPDAGVCNMLVAHHIASGTVRGVDVSGLTWVMACHIPGNILRGDIRAVFFVDEDASPEQRRALADAFGGALGGPLADMAGLVTDRAGPFPAPITFRLDGDGGFLTVADHTRAATAPLRSPYGAPTALRDSVFSSTPGSAVVMAKARELRVDLPEHDLSWRVVGRNAIHGDFHVEA